MRSALDVSGGILPAWACLLFTVCQAVTVNKAGLLNGHAADGPSVAPGNPPSISGQNRGWSTQLHRRARDAAHSLPARRVMPWRFQRSAYGLKIYVEGTCPLIYGANKAARASATPDFCKELGTSRPYAGKGERMYPGKDFPALASYSYASLWGSGALNIHRYFLVRLSCGQDLVRVDTPEEADLCFPSCNASCASPDWFPADGDATNAWGYPTHQLPFEVPTGREAAWGGCGHIGLGSEGTAEDPCQVVIPYYHSVVGIRAARERKADAFRENLAIFAGHSCRGTCPGMEDCLSRGVSLKSQTLMSWDRRGCLLAEMKKYAESLDPDNKRHIFVELAMMATDPDAKKIGANTNFLSMAWDGYARSKFSIQPQGDTPTRRAFYDAWLFGAIPVVDNTSAAIYRRLLLGLVFKEVPFEDVFVVFPDDASGQEVLDMLLSFDDAEIERRRGHLMGLRHYIMWDWGWETNGTRCEASFLNSSKPRFCQKGIPEHDALMMCLGALRTGT